MRTKLTFPPNSRGQEELAEYYDMHLDLFRRIGIIHSKSDDYETQIENSEKMLENVQEIVGGVVNKIKDGFELLDNFTIFKQFMVPFCEMSYMFSLYYQESRVS